MKKVSLIFVLTVAALPLTAQQDQRQLGTHQHGTGHLNVAIEDGVVSMELRIAGADIVGFEYLPTTDADHAAVAVAIDTLSDPSRLVNLAPDAACDLQSGEAKLVSFASKDHDHNHAHNHDTAKGGHSEFLANYVFHCVDQSALNSITFTYFNIFGETHALNVQVVTDSASFGQMLTPAIPVLDLSGGL